MQSLKLKNRRKCTTEVDNAYYAVFFALVLDDLLYIKVYLENEIEEKDTFQ